MRLKFQVTGMTCAACSARVEKVTSGVPGVSRAEVNLLKGSMSVEAEDAQVADKIVLAVQNAGYQASEMGKSGQKSTSNSSENALSEMKRRVIGSGIFLVILMYFTIGSKYLTARPTIVIAFEIANLPASIHQNQGSRSNIPRAQEGFDTSFEPTGRHVTEFYRSCSLQAKSAYISVKSIYQMIGYRFIGIKIIGEA